MTRDEYERKRAELVSKIAYLHYWSRHVSGYDPDAGVDIRSDARAMEVELSALDATGRSNRMTPEQIIDEQMQCPCRIADAPCHPRCTCVDPMSSHGCACCARYGSPEQRKAAANRLVEQAIERLRPPNPTVTDSPDAGQGVGNYFE